MFCTACGHQIADECKFCPECGHPTKPELTASRPPERLVRLRSQKKIAGVCAGFARYLNLDVTLVRIAWLVIALAGVGVGFIAYIVAWIAMPYGDEYVTSPETVRSVTQV